MRAADLGGHADLSQRLDNLRAKVVIKPTTSNVEEETSDEEKDKTEKRDGADQEFSAHWSRYEK